MKKIKKVKAANYCCDGGDTPSIIKVLKKLEEKDKEKSRR